MANTTSALKSIRKARARREIVKSRLSRIGTYIKKLLTVLNSYTDKEVSSDDKKIILDHFVKCQSEIHRGVTKGVLKLNTASRKVARLHKKVKAIID